MANQDLFFDITKQGTEQENNNISLVVSVMVV